MIDLLFSCSFVFEGRVRDARQGRQRRGVDIKSIAGGRKRSAEQLLPGVHPAVDFSFDLRHRGGVLLPRYPDNLGLVAAVKTGIRR